MADWGLLAGLAKGLDNGIQSYRTERDYQDRKRLEAEEKALRERQMRLQALSSGYEVDDSGLLKQTDAQRRKDALKEAEGIAGIRAKGFDAVYNSETGLFDLSPQQGASDFDNQIKKSKLDLIKAQIRSMESKPSMAEAVRLPADKVLSVQQGNQIPKQLDDIKQTLENNKDLFGPIQGRFNSMNPYNERAQTVDAQMRASAQAFGRYMEGGVLRKEDEDKYRKMFPNLTDTPEIAANKLAIVDRLLLQKQKADIEGLKGSGYDVRGVGQEIQVPPVPGILSRKSTQGLISGPLSEAQATGAAPKVSPGSVVIVRGKRYRVGADGDSLEEIR